MLSGKNKYTLNQGVMYGAYSLYVPVPPRGYCLYGYSEDERVVFVLKF
jgi:hypothetical protein